MGRVVHQDFPVVAAGVGGIGTDKIVKGIPSPQYIAVIVRDHIFVMHPALGCPGLKQIYLVVDLDLYIGMAGQCIEVIVPLHAHQTGKTIHQYLDLYPLIRFVKH